MFVASLQNASFTTETRFKRETVKRLQQRCRAAAVRNSTRESGVSGVSGRDRPPPKNTHNSEPNPVQMCCRRQRLPMFATVVTCVRPLI